MSKVLCFSTICGIIILMKKTEKEKEIHPSMIPITLADFMVSYNKNMPVTHPRASTALLVRFQQLYPSLFKNGNLWTLDQHRKKFFEWLPRNVSK